jgi:hypothetical protein
MCDCGRGLNNSDMFTVTISIGVPVYSANRRIAEDGCRLATCRQGKTHARERLKSKEKEANAPQSAASGERESGDGSRGENAHMNHLI